ncbi:hypothetical protein MKC54_09965 [[Clostridium] innocuum]|nr:hypothetical protein [[Clostridium] innocuum]MCR0577211.1 hypothetical protein [[Clostridium] innocuum]
MSKIKIFDPSSYPDPINEIRQKLNFIPKDVKIKLCTTNYLLDDICSFIWNEGHPIFNLHQELKTELLQHEIIAFHNTRIIDPNSILTNGLKFADRDYIKRIHESMIKAGIDQKRMKEILSALNIEINRHEISGKNTRKNKVCFIYDMDYYEYYDKFLAIFGGEFMDFGLSDKLKYKDIVKLGKPYVIEFYIPFEWISNIIIDIARIMLEDWIHRDIRKDATQHRYDGWVEQEIPPSSIINLHKVDDYFPETDDWFFQS